MLFQSWCRMLNMVLAKQHNIPTPGSCRALQICSKCNQQFCDPILHLAMALPEQTIDDTQQAESNLKDNCCQYMLHMQTDCCLPVEQGMIRTARIRRTCQQCR